MMVIIQEDMIKNIHWLNVYRSRRIVQIGEPNLRIKINELGYLNPNASVWYDETLEVLEP